MEIDICFRAGVNGVKLDYVIEPDPDHDEEDNEFLPTGQKIPLEGVSPQTVTTNILNGKWKVPWAEIAKQVPVASLFVLSAAVIDEQGMPVAYVERNTDGSIEK